MSKNIFFSPTAVYKEYLVLESIGNNEDITQREIANIVNASLSMVNQYIMQYEEEGYIIKNNITRKTIKYYLTEKGKERMKVLNIQYLSDAQGLYKRAKSETITFINKIIEMGYHKILFYGAGEVAEILLQTINDDHSLPVTVVGVIDDSVDKQGNVIVNNIIQGIDIIKTTNHDCILIASYTNHDVMYNKLMDLNYPEDKIVYFFK